MKKWSIALVLALASVAIAAQNFQGVLFPGDGTMRLPFNTGSTTQSNYGSMHVNSGGHLFWKPNGGSDTQLDVGGGAQTPWTSNIDGGGYYVTDVKWRVDGSVATSTYAVPTTASRTIYYPNGSSTVEFDLPTCAEGLEYQFRQNPAASTSVTVKATNSDTIRLGGTVGGANTTCVGIAPAARCYLIGVGNPPVWEAVSYAGSWTVDGTNPGTYGSSLSLSGSITAAGTIDELTPQLVRVARNATDQSITDNTIVDISWDTELLDPAGISAVGAGANVKAFTCVVAGTYEVNAIVQWSNHQDSAPRDLFIRQYNASNTQLDDVEEVRFGEGLTGGGISNDATVYFHMAATDYVKAAVYQHSSTTMSLSSNGGNNTRTFTALCARRIGP